MLRLGVDLLPPGIRMQHLSCSAHCTTTQMKQRQCTRCAAAQREISQNLSSWKPGAGKRSFPPTGNKLMTQTCLIPEFTPTSLSKLHLQLQFIVSFWFSTHHSFISLLAHHPGRDSPDTKYLVGAWRGGGQCLEILRNHNQNRIGW